MGEEELRQIVERLAVLETQMKTETEARRDMDKKLDEMLLKMTRYEGKVGGIILMLAAVGTFVRLIWVDIKRIFGGD